MGRLIWAESESRGTLSVEDVALRSLVVVVDGARVPLAVLPRLASIGEIRAVASEEPGVLVVLRGVPYGERLPAELPPEAVLDVHRTENLQAALCEADRKLGRLDEAMGPIAGSGGIEIAFTTRVHPDFVLLLAAAGSNVRALRSFLDGSASRDPRWT